MSATTGCSPVFLKLSLAGNASGGLLDAPIPEHEEVEVDLSPHVVKSGGLRASQEHVERKNTQEREFIEWRSHIIQEASLKQQRKRKTSTPVHRADLEALSIIPPSKKTNATEVPKSANGHLEIHEHKQMTNLLNPTRTRVSRINAHLDMGMRKGRASPSPLGKKGPYQDASSRGVTKSRSRSRKGSKTRISGAKKGGAFVSPARKVTSKYIGVSYHSNRGKWQVKIRSNGKQKHLGYFDDEIEAARAYNCAAIAVHANPKLNKVSDVDLKEGSHALKARIMDITQPKAEPQGQALRSRRSRVRENPTYAAQHKTEAAVRSRSEPPMKRESQTSSKREGGRTPLAPQHTSQSAGRRARMSSSQSDLASILLNLKRGVGLPPARQESTFDTSATHQFFVSREADFVHSYGY